MNAPITLRTVDRFPEPEFTELVARLLHDPDRRAVAERVFGPREGRPVSTPSDAQQVRIGAWAGERLVGWSHGILAQTGVLYVSNSAVEHEFRRQGIYTQLIAAMEEAARGLGCFRIESHHRTANTAVLIAKLKAGYTIVGTEFSGEMGLLVKMAKPLEERRDALMRARMGILEGAVRYFAAPVE